MWIEVASTPTVWRFLAFTFFQKGSVTVEPPTTAPGTNQSPSKFSSVNAAGTALLNVCQWYIVVTGEG